MDAIDVSRFASRRFASPLAAARAMAPTVILDLDGTLINTEQLVDEICTAVVLEIAPRLSPSVVHDALERVRGMRPLEASRALCASLELSTLERVTGEALLERTSPLLDARWREVRLMPGARRLLEHLRARGVPFGLATSTPATYLKEKMRGHEDVLAMMDCVVTGCMVNRGKPDPEIFVAASAKLGAEASACVVLEDTPVGCEAARRAGCKTIAIPSIRDRKCFEAWSDVVLHSLYDLELEKFGLPAFDDWLPVGDGSADRVLPVPTIEMRGPVVKGFGRGSTQLGIPTANLDIVPLKHQVDSLAPGIYLGFASIRGETHKMVMSIGWNPYFDNSKKTIEPWLLHEFESDFYGEELSLVVVGYIRPEADFTTLEALVERIHRDAQVARVVLEREPFVGKRQMLMP